MKDKQFEEAAEIEACTPITVGSALSESTITARKYRRQAREIAKFVSLPAEGDWMRACGDCICDECQLPYFDHPERDSLHLLCTGEWVKL